MKKRILKYLADMDALLRNPPEGTDYEEEIRKHLVQIGFFMHERLIHLIVTVIFALLTIGSVFFSVLYPSIAVLALVVCLLVLLVPYIMHYYLLENGVQKMYTQYDELLRRAELMKKEKKEPGEESSRSDR